MNYSFLNNFQPFVVKFIDDICIPKSCRGKYLLCINAMGIKWFEENYITLEYGDGFVEGEVLGPKYLMLEDSGANKFDMPRIYVLITKELLSNSTSELGKFLIKALTDNSVYGTGIEGFRPSKEYYLNETLYKWCTRTKDHTGNDIQSLAEEDDDIYLPDYLYYDRENDKPNITSYFEELSDNEKKSIDLNFFFNKNEISDLKFTEDDFYFFPQTFFKIILKYTAITEENRQAVPNNVYDAVQKYFANHENDEATKLLQTIMNTSTDGTDLPSTISTCNSCTNQYNLLNGKSNIGEKSCLEKYKDAMDSWLKIMLGDLVYYNSWMTVNENNVKYPNYDLIDLLIEFLNEYIKYNNFPSKEHNSITNFNCPSLDSSYNDSDCIKNTIMNYIKVLEWVKKCETVKNRNKIKVYGKDFANYLLTYF